MAYYTKVDPTDLGGRMSSLHLENKPKIAMKTKDEVIEYSRALEVV